MRWWSVSRMYEMENFELSVLIGNDRSLIYIYMGVLR